MMDIENLPPELQEKAKACKTPEDFLALAKEEGYKLSDAKMEAIAGGRQWGDRCDDFSCDMLRPTSGRYS